MNLKWHNQPPAGATTITTIDAHTAGEPLRIIIGGIPEPTGATILERRRFMQQHLDFARRALIWEPRGHYNMYGCLLTPPNIPEADFGVLFLHNEGYSTMCGHGIIALITALVQMGVVNANHRQQVPVNLDTPAGLVKATAHLDEMQRVERVSFINVPSFLYTCDLAIDLPTYGHIVVDIAFGGAFYAILPASHLGLSVVPEQTSLLVQAGEAIKKAVNAHLTINHPLEKDLSFLYGTILTGPPENPQHYSRNITIFANSEVDRSPTGTGVSARLALHHAKGELPAQQEIVIESILGAASAFHCRIIDQTQIGPHPAIIPEVSGTAFITGLHEFILDPRDELGKGFLL